MTTAVRKVEMRTFKLLIKENHVGNADSRRNAVNDTTMRVMTVPTK